MTTLPEIDVDTTLARHLADAQMNVELDTGDMVLNIGPQHPATHGTLRLVVRLDGERVVAADPIIGYMHRGYEKLVEFRTYPQVTTLINRIDWKPAPREGDEASGDTSSPVQPTEMTFGAAGSAGRFQVFAHVQSTSRHWGVTLKADVDDTSPHLDSWVPVYAGADWHERECWEMFGIGFDGHPSLRHLYLPAEFEGHPLRKDYALLARVVKPWPGLVDVEPMPGDDTSPSESPEGSAGVPTDEAGEAKVLDAS